MTTKASGVAHKEAERPVIAVGKDTTSLVSRGLTARHGYALVAAAATSWGLWPILLRSAEAYGPLPSAVESTVLMTVTLLATMPFALWQRTTDSPAFVERKPWHWLAVVVLGVSDALNVLLFFAAYRKTTVAIAVLTHYLTPVLVAVAAPLVLRERATLKTAVATGIACGGLALLLEPWNSQAAMSGAPTGSGQIVGALFGAGSAVFYATNVLVQKRVARLFSPLELIAFHSVVAVPVLMLAVPTGALASVDPRALGILVASALGPGVAASFAFIVGLRLVPSSHASTITLLEPLVAVLLGVFFFGERIGPLGMLGVAGILGGALLVIRSPSAPP